MTADTAKCCLLRYPRYRGQITPTFQGNHQRDAVALRPQYLFASAGKRNACPFTKSDQRFSGFCARQTDDGGIAPVRATKVQDNHCFDVIIEGRVHGIGQRQRFSNAHAVPPCSHLNFFVRKENFPQLHRHGNHLVSKDLGIHKRKYTTPCFLLPEVNKKIIFAILNNLSLVSAVEDTRALRRLTRHGDPKPAGFQDVRPNPG